MLEQLARALPALQAHLNAVGVSLTRQSAPRAADMLRGGISDHL